MKIGSTIKMLRKRRDMLQAELSEACAMTQSYLSQIENNKREPTIPTLRLICEQLEVPLPVLVLMSIEMDDLPEDRRAAYETLIPAMRSFLDGIFISESNIGQTYP